MQAFTGCDIREHIKWIVGVDEAGRGPLAGPVSVGVVAARTSSTLHLKKTLYGIRDSKKLSPQKRLVWVEQARLLEARSFIQYTSSLVGSVCIDRHGITRAISKGISRSLSRMNIPPHESFILLDGGLRAPEKFLFQKTIIKGDDKEPLIALASILAKVRRDNYMTTLSHALPEYGFERHKGYGTSEHMRMIRKHGLSLIHRRYFVHL